MPWISASRLDDLLRTHRILGRIEQSTEDARRRIQRRRTAEVIRRHDELIGAVKARLERRTSDDGR